MSERIQNFKSGVGDYEDLRPLNVTQPDSHLFDFNWRLRGYKERAFQVYEDKQIEYRFVANGTENFWAGAGDTLLRLRYYPRKQADYRLTASAFLPHTFSYRISADIEYLSTANYTVSAPYTVHASGRVVVAQSPFNYRILCDVTTFFAGGVSDTHTVYGTWQAASVTSANYDMSTASQLSISTSRDTMTPLVSAYLATRTGVLSHSIGNYRVETNNAEYFAYTNNNGNSRVHGITLRVGAWRTVTDNISRNETFTVNDASVARVLSQTPVATMLASAVSSANMQVYFYHVECPVRMANIFVNNNGLLTGHLSGTPTYARSQVHFDYRIQATVQYRNHLGNIATDTIMSPPLRTATTRNDLRNHMIDARTSSQILSPQLNAWRVTNRAIEIISATYDIQAYKFIKVQMDYNHQKIYNAKNIYQPLGTEEPFSFCITNANGLGNITGNTNENNQIGVPKLKTIHSPILMTNTDLRTATSSSTALNITANTAEQIMLPHITNDPDVATSVGYVIFSYTVMSKSPGITYMTNSNPPTSSVIKAFRSIGTSPGVDFSGLWNFSHDIRAYQQNHLPVNTRSFLPTSVDGAQYQQEDITYVLTPQNVGVDYARTGVNIAWAGSGTSGARTGHGQVSVSTDVFVEHNQILYIPFTGLLEWRIDVLALGFSTYPGDTFDCHYGITKIPTAVHLGNTITSHPGSGIEWKIDSSAKTHSNNFEIITATRNANTIRLTSEPSPSTRPWTHTTPWLTASVNQHDGFYFSHEDGKKDAIVPISIDVPPGVADGDFVVACEFRNVSLSHISGIFIDSGQTTTNRRADRLNIEYTNLVSGKAEPMDWEGPWNISDTYEVKHKQDLQINFVSPPASSCPIENIEIVELEVLSNNPLVKITIEEAPPALDGIIPHKLKAIPLDDNSAWSLEIKNGHYYFNQEEYYYGLTELSSQPDIFASISLDANMTATVYPTIGENSVTAVLSGDTWLTPVYALDENNALTLTVTDEIQGNKTPTYNLSRNNIDKPTLTIEIYRNATIIKSISQSDCTIISSTIILPESIDENLTIVCKYMVKNSYIFSKKNDRTQITVNGDNISPGSSIKAFAETSSQSKIPVNIGTVGQNKNSGFIVLDDQVFIPEKISIHSNNNILVSDGIDSTSIIVSVTDKFNNPIPSCRVEITSLTKLGSSYIYTNNDGIAIFMHRSLRHEFVDKIIASTENGLSETTTIHMVAPSKLFNVTLISNGTINLIDDINFWSTPAKLTVYVQSPNSESLSGQEVVFSTNWGNLNIVSDFANHSDNYHSPELSMASDESGIVSCFVGLKAKNLDPLAPWNANTALAESFPSNGFIIVTATVTNENHTVTSSTTVPVVSLKLHKQVV